MRAFVISMLLILGISAVASRIPYSFCATPQTYKIGVIDARFRFSEADAVQNIREAVEILGTYGGAPMFAYEQTAGNITVNFVYDARSQLDTSIDAQSKQLDSESSSLAQKQAAFESRVRDYNKNVTEFGSTVEKYRASGEITEDVYQQLSEQKRALDAEASALTELEHALRSEIRGYNSKVNVVNTDITTLKREIALKPEEGVYDSEHNAINIYFIRDKQELLHTIAHEFGHVLGMDHVDDPQAIMYPSVSSTTQMSQADTASLSAICKPVPLPVYWIRNIRQSLELIAYRIRSQK